MVVVIVVVVIVLIVRFRNPRLLLLDPKQSVRFMIRVDSLDPECPLQRTCACCFVTRSRHEMVIPRRAA